MRTVKTKEKDTAEIQRDVLLKCGLKLISCGHFFLSSSPFDFLLLNPIVDPAKPTAASNSATLQFCGLKENTKTLVKPDISAEKGKEA